MRRRTFLGWLAASPAVTLLPGCTSAPTPFPQGVASGDPSPDGVLLWTRLESATEVQYEVATDRDFADIVASGTQVVSEETDRTVRVEVTGLQPRTTYWYRFTADSKSAVGRTRTAPRPDDDVPLTIAVASCQDFGGRWFKAWRVLAERDDIDFVLFIGDYIYETIGHLNAKLGDRDLELPDGLVLEDPLKGRIAALTLADYRTLYREYRRDPDLQAVHAQFPFVMMWDDHEFANDCWGDHATDFDDYHGDEASPERRAAANRAWHEYSPIRRDPDAAIFRTLRWGRHAEIVLVDERSYRDDDVVPEGPIDRDVGHIQQYSAFGARTFVIKDVFDAREAAAHPTMVGNAQRDWLVGAITSSTATWKVVASPLVMAQMVLDLSGYAQLPDNFRQRYYFKTDQWDGFRSERRAILDACAGVQNLVVLSGDLHGFYAAELHANYDALDQPIGVEYATSAISAATVDVQLSAVVESDRFLKGLGLGELVPMFDANLLATNPHIRHAESTRNGLAIVSIDAAATNVQFVSVGDVTSPDDDALDIVAFRTPLGSRRIDRVA